VPDAELLAQWRAGNQLAATELFRRHRAHVARFFRARFAGDIGDLLQRTWVAVIESRERICRGDRFGPYCLGIARNVAFEEIRARVRRTPSAADLGLCAAAPSPCEVAIEHETRQQLARAVSLLHRDLAAVVQHYYFERTAAPAVGRALGIPENTARSRLRRARVFLKLQMGS
jgi:RNA polymerase sigma-70 factor (ECF subfamily)